MLQIPSLLFFIASSIQLSYASVGPSSSLVVSNKVISPDGYTRSSVLVNGVYPAPLIKATKGDKFRLNVINSLTDNTMLRTTSIHWHGIAQHGSNWADGVAGVSQCPIAPNHSFLYQFSAPDQAGTFWYHSHFGTQYCDGLRGPLVIYDPRDPHKNLYDVDDESTIITLGEWYHTQTPSIVGIAQADSTLINGKGRYPGGPKVDLAIVNVERGKRYRIRLLSISCDPNYFFSIDGHNLTIIETDGQNTVPNVVNSIQIFAGQRYSFVLNANQPVNNYWIRALPNSGYRNLTAGYSGGVNSAILRYKGAPNRDPTTNSTQNNPLNEVNLHPLTNPAAPGAPTPSGADKSINIALSVDLVAGRFLVNGTSFIPPTVPVLLQILSGKYSAQELLPQGSVIPLPKNKVIELSIPAGVIGGPHPFHLHGHAFSVIRSAGSDKLNYINPVRRDVVSIGDTLGDNVTIRFTTDNPGPWILHCHIDFHLDLGMAIVFAEDTTDTKSLINPPSSWDQLCPIYNALSPAQTSIHTVAPAPTA
ncbi:laccase [Crucibulum laeve]|uniref:laccase n=1 Tax=Crucibulum laeve TaxID=68775 RepID=A0A5C3LMV4_9AGAR|nr:laccase [Crucibulum laeve]